MEVRTFKTVFNDDRAQANARCMKLHGSIADNLDNAVVSARRLRGHPVYKDTLVYWDSLLHEARRVRRTGSSPRPEVLDEAIARLEAELAGRSA